ncbi:hypothetical protein OH76DRAFT_559801 [Lentinus brumalis]|uniref:Uncharacterized protein n=1 Tax=Lentinus brumalis TaxID=2498619 RepID=A0A371D9E7_9APHY|nr:hypothetical protein OH76DRAFT_559801 [Polyporus brumalis]
MSDILLTSAAQSESLHPRGDVPKHTWSAQPPAPTTAMSSQDLSTHDASAVPGPSRTAPLNPRLDAHQLVDCLSTGELVLTSSRNMGSSALQSARTTIKTTSMNLATSAIVVAHILFLDAVSCSGTTRSPCTRTGSPSSPYSPSSLPSARMPLPGAYILLQQPRLSSYPRSPWLWDNTSDQCLGDYPSSLLISLRTGSVPILLAPPLTGLPSSSSFYLSKSNPTACRNDGPHEATCKITRLLSRSQES